jgi:hypothetical protein
VSNKEELQTLREHFTLETLVTYLIFNIDSDKAKKQQWKKTLEINTTQKRPTGHNGYSKTLAHTDIILKEWVACFYKHACTDKHQCAGCFHIRSLKMYFKNPHSNEKVMKTSFKPIQRDVQLMKNYSWIGVYSMKWLRYQRVIRSSLARFLKKGFGCQITKHK